MTLQRLLNEGQSRGFVPFAGNVAFQDLAFVIYCPPQIDHLAIQLRVHFVEVPAPMAKAPHPACPLSPDIGGEYRPEPVPPQPYRFRADVNPAFEQQIFDIAQAQRKPDVHQHRKADDLR